MAFQIPSVPPTTNKNIRFPNTLIAQVEELIRNNPEGVYDPRPAEVGGQYAMPANIYYLDDVSYESFVRIQSETALRHMATKYPYDSPDTGVISLRGNTEEVAQGLAQELQEKLRVAGVQVLEARLNHLAYAPEIASAMLQRQQANAIVAARQKIVEGAVGMVDDALSLLEAKKVIQLTEEQKAQMISNLMVAIVSEKGTQPVMQAGNVQK